MNIIYNLMHQLNKFSMKLLDHLKILVIELYNMDQNNMDIQLLHVNKHVYNINILLYKMEMEILDGVVVEII